MREIDKFNKQNTEGFSQKKLDKMNERLEKAMEKYEENDPMYNELLQHECEKIFRKYC